MWCWHKWDKWGDPWKRVWYEIHGTREFTRMAQTRVCLKCGKQEIRDL
jgi:hypothetical protein